MTSSEGLASIDPWTFRQSFGTYSWLVPSRDNDLLTKALQKSISSAQQTLAPDSVFPSVFLDTPTATLRDPSSVPTVSYASGGSEPETVSALKRKRGAVSVNGYGGKVKKRRSRTSKRSQTTFITADPANFRQMVQQITGARDSGGYGLFTPIVKPEPQRPGSRLPCGPSDRLTLPTLDTSAFLSYQEDLLVGHAMSETGPAIGSGAVASCQPSVAVDGGGGAGLEFDAYPSFPTLESWKVM